MNTVRKPNEVNVNIFKRRGVVAVSLSLFTRSLDTYQGLPADGFDESIDYFCDQLGADFGSPQVGRIAIHTALPIGALLNHRRRHLRGVAKVCLVLRAANCDILDDIWKTEGK